MKNALWFLIGVVGGFVAAHLLNKDPRGHELLAEVDARIAEFTDRVGGAYRTQEAKFGVLLDDAKDAASGALDTVAAAATGAAETATGAAAGAAARAAKPTD